jgi:uncharacterized protein (DUF305 family)
MRRCAGLLYAASISLVTLARPLRAQTPPGCDNATRQSAEASHVMRAAQRDTPSVRSADRRFVAAMLPHHLAAIEMARIELLCGTDPEMRRLAEEIIVDQQSEIDAMSRWLRRSAALPPPVTPAP